MRHEIDGSTLRDKVSTLDAIAAAMDFPDYFGRNLDALYDCLLDLSWLPEGEHVLVWRDSHVLRDQDQRAYLDICSVLSDAADANDRFTFELR
jgi:RNAse (barnase) inhibitor barstar